MTKDESQFHICLHKCGGVIQSFSSLYLVPKASDPVSFPEARYLRRSAHSLRAQKFVLLPTTQNQEKIKLRRISLFLFLDDTSTKHVMPPFHPKVVTLIFQVGHGQAVDRTASQRQNYFTPRGRKGDPNANSHLSRAAVGLPLGME